MDSKHNIYLLRNRRRELRKEATPQEKELWFELRHSKLGVKFKRQYSIGGYITDFYCQKYKLIVELDGSVHDTEEAREYDKIRNNYFRELGYKLLRIQNSKIDSDIKSVLKNITNHLV